MKILLTGTTASQVSPRKNEIVPTFSGLVYEALIEARHDVVWAEPSVSMTKEYLAEFDSVVVGLAPPTSTAAHRIYGALSVVFYANQLGNLRLLLDAPEPKRVWAGIRAAHKNPSDLTKSFHYKRREYKLALTEDVLPRLHGAVSALYSNEWPITVFPVTPWMSFPSISSVVPNTNARNLVGLNFDDRIINRISVSPDRDGDFWVCDYPNTSWAKKIEKTIINTVVSAHSHRWEDNADSVERISKSIGCLVSLHKNGDPWWSLTLPQALGCGVPVATDWRLSSMLGESWSILPSAIEGMNDNDRYSLASAQRESYLANIKPYNESVDFACNALLER